MSGRIKVVQKQEGGVNNYSKQVAKAFIIPPPKKALWPQMGENEKSH